MSEKADLGEQGVLFRIENIYVKDLSFEAPGSPGIFLEKWDSCVEFQLNTAGEELNTAGEELLNDGRFFNVSLTITVTNKRKLNDRMTDQIVYLVESTIGGIFEIVRSSDNNLPALADEDIATLIAITWPSTLLPYSRELISNLVVRGGFVPLFLPPVDFESAYRQQLAKITEAHALQ